MHRKWKIKHSDNIRPPDGCADNGGALPAEKRVLAAGGKKWKIKHSDNIRPPMDQADNGGSRSGAKQIHREYGERVQPHR